MNQQRFKLTKGLFSDEASKILTQLCQAVKHLHNHSVIHRDIKPENILVTLVIFI
jgi:serine/threonine protein kinase